MLQSGHEHPGPLARDGHPAGVQQVADAGRQPRPLKRGQVVRPEREEEGEEIEPDLAECRLGMRELESYWLVADLVGSLIETLKVAVFVP